MNTADLYNALLLNDDTGKKAKLLLLQTHWFTVNAIFDPRSGEALPQPLTSFCQKLAFPKSNEGPLQLHDRLWRITEHARDAVEHLIRSLNENPKREHALLPIRAVKELDAVSFIKLSQRPGRNIREKLSGKPYLQAVRRYQSIDLPENRLLKAFAVRLHELLTIRKECLGRVLDEGEDPLLSTLDSWLRSDEARSIAQWENLPPNNTLLSHRDYRRVWDAWTWLQSLDEDVDKDFSNLERRQQVMTFWQKVAQYRFSTDTIMAELPIVFDYENFIIDTWGGQEIFMTHGDKKRYQLSQYTPLPNVLSAKEDEPQETQIHVPVCVDFSSTAPVYSIGEGSKVIPELFVWQKWESEKDSYDLISTKAKAITLGDKVKTIQPKYLFQEHDDIDKSIVEQAAFSFAREWHRIFNNDTLVWLVPDLLNDFDLEVARRNINSVFSDAQPLPRSIAAIYQFVDFSKIKSDGFPVTVVDKIGGLLSATKLTARFDPKLKELVPETYGYAWERHPSKVIENETEDTYDFHTVNTEGIWNFRKKNNPASKVDERLKKSLGIGNEFCINLTESPVLGGFKVYKLQCSAGDAPLWYDHLPNLAMRVQINGIMSNFQLVKNKTILPIRGQKIPLEIPQKFTLSAGEKDYKFPLVQGDDGARSKYMAHLFSPMFPLKENNVFSLTMTYEYGADIPYQLIFVSDKKINGQVLKIIVSWQPYTGADEFINAYNYPVFPPPPSWENILSNTPGWTLDCFKKSWWKKFNSLYSQQIEFQKNAEQLVKVLYCTNAVPSKSFGFGRLSETAEDVYCNAKAFRNHDEFMCWCNGDTMFAIIEQRDKGLAAVSVSPDIEELKKEQIRTQQKNLARLKRSLHYSLYNILGNLQEWTGIGECSQKFSQQMLETLQYVVDQLQHFSPPEFVTKEMYMLLAFTHKYAPKEFGEYITNVLASSQWKEYITEIGYSIGDSSQPWQKNAWDTLLSHWTERGIVEASSIRIMNIALFRCPKLMDRFTFEQADRYIDKIVSRLERDIHKLNMAALVEYSNAPKFNDSKNKREYIALWKDGQKITALLELTLLILRLRSSEDEKIKNLLHPTSSRVLHFLNLLGKLDDINFNNLSRVKISVVKPQAAAHLSDLLFALKYYLSGSKDDAGIQILEVANETDE